LSRRLDEDIIGRLVIPGQAMALRLALFGSPTIEHDGATAVDAAR